MLSRNSIGKSGFSWRKMQEKEFEDIKMNYVLTPLYSHINYKKKQQLQVTPPKKLLRVSFARRTSSYICFEQIDSSEAKVLIKKAWSTGNCLCGHKTERVSFWKKIYPKDRSQATQIPLCIRRRNYENSMS